MHTLRHLAWTVPLVIGACLMCLDVTEQWAGSYDANGALFSTAARNYLRHGLVATRGGQLITGGHPSPEHFRFYAHHPPGISLTIAASFAAFGVHEWAARLVPIAFTVGSAALLCVLAWRLGGAWAALFATLVYVVQPMVAFYGRMPDHEAPAAFFALLLVVLYLQWQASGRWPWLAAMGVATFAGLWYAWAVFVVPWLLLACHAVVKGRGWKAMLVPVAAAAVGFLAVLGHVALVEGGLGELLAALTHRLGSQAGDRGATGSFGLGEFLVRQYHYFVPCFSVTALAAAVLWAVAFARRQKAVALFVAALALFGLFNVVGFRQGAYVHLYYQFYLAMPLALAAGLGLDGLRSRARWRVPLTALALLVAVGIVAEGWLKLKPIQQYADLDYLDQVEVARKLGLAAKPEQRVLLLWGQRSSFRQLIYYADLDVTVARDAATTARLRATGEFDLCLQVKAMEGNVQGPLLRPWPEAPPAPAPGQ